MNDIDVNGADRMRQADRVIDAITRKLDAHRSVLGRSRHGTLKWRIEANGKVLIEFQPTL